MIVSFVDPQKMGNGSRNGQRIVTQTTAKIRPTKKRNGLKSNSAKKTWKKTNVTFKSPVLLQNQLAADKGLVQCACSIGLLAENPTGC
jgi:hypothetical protein